MKSIMNDVINYTKELLDAKIQDPECSIRFINSGPSPSFILRVWNDTNDEVMHIGLFKFDVETTIT